MRTFQLPTILVLILSWATLMGGVRAFFEFASKAMSQDKKNLIGDNLTRATSLAAAFTIAPSSLEAVFDGVFGTRHLSLKCVTRSCILTAILLSSLLFYWYVFSVYRASEYTYWLALSGWFRDTLVFAMVFGYLWLWVTRWLVRLVAGQNSMWIMLAIFALDITFKVAVPMAAISAAVWYKFGEHPSWEQVAIAGAALRTHYTCCLPNEANNDSAGFIMFSVQARFPRYIASLWSVMVSVTYVIALLLLYCRKRIGFAALTFLDFRTNSVEALGWVVMFVVSVLFVIAIFIKS